MRKLQNKLLFIFLLFGQRIIAQEFVIDTIVFTETVDGKNHSNIPFVRNLLVNKKKIADKINLQIKERFMIESFDPTINKEFRWYDVEFNSEIIDHTLLISFQGEYYGTYLNMINENLYFDLLTGEKIQEEKLDYNFLFSNQGFFDFLDRFWIQGCDKEFKKAIECADLEPYCSPFDIIFSSNNEVAVEHGKIRFSLVSDCYPHVVQACSPFFEIQISLSELKPFLSPFGIFTLFESGYLAKTTLEKHLFFKKNKWKIPFTYFIQGRIDAKYRFNMVIEINQNSKEAKGFYYYDSKRLPLRLKGYFDNKSILVNEKVDNKKTGQFLFLHKETKSSKMSIVSGKWIDTKQRFHDIEILDIRQKK